MRTVAPLDARGLAGLFARYDVGEPRRCRAASLGIENSNYFVTTVRSGREHEWVLTLLEQPSYCGPAYVPLLDLCHAAGLPVAPLVRNAAGEAIETWIGKQAMLAPRLLGAHVDVPGRGHLETLGRVIADFHAATTTPAFEVPPYPRDQRWLKDRSASTRGRAARTDERLLFDCVDRVNGMLDRADVRELLPSGIVHGDLFRDNVLFDGPELTGVLDFHHAARGYLVYDLAVAVNDWCNGPGGVLDQERAAALVTAYHRTRPLSDLERELFPGFLLYAALAFWLSRLVVALETDPGATARFKDPDEFRAIVADRNASFFRIDFLD